jgi:hypothetical protein
VTACSTGYGYDGWWLVWYWWLVASVWLELCCCARGLWVGEQQRAQDKHM